MPPTHHGSVPRRCVHRLHYPWWCPARSPPWLQNMKTSYAKFLLLSRVVKWAPTITSEQDTDTFISLYQKKHMLTSLSLKDSGHYFSQITYWPHWRLRDNHTHITLDLDPDEQKSISHSTQMPYTWQGTIGKNGLRTWSIHPLPSQSTPYIELRSVVFIV